MREKLMVGAILVAEALFGLAALAAGLVMAAGLIASVWSHW